MYEQLSRAPFSFLFPWAPLRYFLLIGEQMTDWLSFKLPDEFVESYKDIEPPFGFGVLGKLSFYRTYSRKKENGEKEKWYEVIRRCVEGSYSLQKDHIQHHQLPWKERKAISSAKKMYDHMFNMRFLPPGRGLWMMGTEYAHTKTGLGLYNCLAAETKVLTRQGYRPIKDISGSDQTILTSTGGWRNASFKSYGVQELQKITLSRQGVKKEIFATPNHIWFAKTKSDISKDKPFRELTTAELQEGMRLRTQLAQGAGKPSPQGIQHGIGFGDGTSNHVVLVGEKKSLVRYFSSNDRYEEPERDAVRVADTPSFFKSVPNLEWDRKYLLGWAMGYFAADGSVSKNENITISSSDRSNLEFFQDVCSILGIGTYSITLSSTSSNFSAERELWKLSIAPSTVDESFFLMESHRKNFNAEKMQRHWNVISVEKTDRVEEVYCAEVPELHNFVIEGDILTHNCAFISTEDLDRRLTDPFTYLMDVSMLGVGCGFDNLGAGMITLQQPTTPVCKYEIPDSREGWVESLNLLLLSYFLKDRPTVEFDYSNIRPEGEPIKGFGGVCSGYKPLEKLHNKIRSFFDGREGEKITSRDITDVMNSIGECVVAGNVRRSAILALGLPEDEEFLDLKNYERFPYRREHGGMSNNSIDSKTGMDYAPFIERTINNGEPGYLWMDTIRKYGRLEDPPNWKDASVKGSNPCFPEGTLLLTKTGMKPIEKIIAGSDEVWSSEGWALVEKLFSNGVQSIYNYQTNAGSIVATETHKILQGGVKVPIGEAESVDILAGCSSDNLEIKIGLWGNLIMDGLVVGDGTKHGRPGSKIPLLCIGEKDRDYFEHGQVKHLIGKSYSRDDIFKVETDVDVEELVPTYERYIPDRYFQMDHQSRCSFLKGLFSANGSVLSSAKTKRVTFKTASLRMANQVQLMLSSVGIRTYKTRNKSKQVEFSNGAYRCKESWDVNITTDRGVFFKQIGFLQSYKMTALETILPKKDTEARKKSYEINSSEYVGEAQVYDIQVANSSHTYWCQGFNVSNCVEQSLESGECCNLVEIFPTHIKSQKEFKDVIKAAYLYGKSVTLAKTHRPEINQIQMRNRRIGLSLSGLALFRDTRGVNEMIEWMDNGYKIVQDYDEVYSDWMAIPKSRKTTCVKPSGTVSLLAGVSAGIHFPMGKHYMKNIRISKGSRLVEWARESGMTVEPETKFRLVYDENGEVVQENGWDKWETYESQDTVVVSIPVKFDDDIRGRADVSVWEQIKFVSIAQRYWADNQVSCTVNFLPHEKEDVLRVVEMFDRDLKNVSFLPTVDSGYAQMPEQKLTEEEYEKYVSGLDIKPMEDYLTEEAVGEAGCSNDTCTL